VIRLDPPEVTRSAVEAAEWCARQLQRGPALLRSDELRPQRDFFGGDAVNVTIARGADCVDIANHVVARRRRLLEDRGWIWRGQRLEQYSGRLLIFRHELSLLDGAAEDLSGGLFDVYDQPPWEAWVAYVEGTDGAPSGLLSWIPSALLPAAKRGIFANAEQCLEWVPEDQAI